jgi:type I protein arginine methyltransferase
MYSLQDFGNMIADAERFGAYSKAIAEAVRPGDVVLEIGCGPGAFALLACRAGAKKVYAIDTEEVVYFAREVAVANGLTERMEFIQSDSRKAQLPERVNVIISDIRGVLPLYDHAISSIEDARRRFLVPGGILIPQRDTLKVSLVEAGDDYSRLTSPWHDSIRDVDFSSALSLVLHGSYASQFKREQLPTEARSWCVLDYTAGASQHATAELHFLLARPATVHGVCIWFETQLFDGIGYSSGPDGASTIYGQVFLPWLEAVQLMEGQEVYLGLHADLIGSDYIWRWETTICGRGGQGARHFKQSTFQGANFTPQVLRRRAADFVPSLSEEGRADRWLLQAMDGKASLQQMAQEATEQFPKIFPRWEDALRRAAELAAQFSR